MKEFDALKFYADEEISEVLAIKPIGWANLFKKNQLENEKSIIKEEKNIVKKPVNLENIDNLKDLEAALNNFYGCSLKDTAINTVFGGGNPKSKIMLIGEAPGGDEDKIGQPFVGRSGQLLDKMLASIGLKSREDYYITNVVPWRPPGNRKPSSAEIATCLPFLIKQIEIIKPDIIILLGGSAAAALLGGEDSITKIRGKWKKYNDIDVIPTFHPAYLLRGALQKAKAWQDLIEIKKKISKFD